MWRNEKKKEKKELIEEEKKKEANKSKEEYKKDLKRFSDQEVSTKSKDFKEYEIEEDEILLLKEKKPIIIMFLNSLIIFITP